MADTWLIVFAALVVAAYVALQAKITLDRRAERRTAQQSWAAWCEMVRESMDARRAGMPRPHLPRWQEPH